MSAPQTSGQRDSQNNQPESTPSKKSTQYDLKDIMIDLQADAKKFNPKSFNVDEIFMHCEVLQDVQNMQHAPKGVVMKLNKAEHKLLNNDFIQQALADTDLEAFAFVDSKSFIMKPESGSTTASVALIFEDDTNPLRNVKYRTVVVSWNGRGTPPAALNLEEYGIELVSDCGFRRIWKHKKEAMPNDLRWRWTSVQLVDNLPEQYQGQKGLQDLYDEMSEEAHTQDFTLHCIPLQMQVTNFKLPDVLQQMREQKGIDYFAAKRLYSMAEALMRREYVQNEQQVNHANKFFDLAAEEGNLQLNCGVKYSVGRVRQLGLNAAEPPQAVLTTGICPKLFLPPDSVGDFMATYLTNSRDESVSDYYESALRGKAIRFSSGVGRLTKNIVAISKHNPESAEEEDKHPCWRGMAIDDKLLNPHLPCIDIGTSRRRVLLPPDLCTFVPGQSFKRPQTGALYRDLTRVRKENRGSPLAEVGINNTGYIVKMEKPATLRARRFKLDQLVTQLALDGAGLFFVTTGLTAMSSDLWRRFQSQLARVKVLNKMKVNVGGIDPLFLQHRSGENNVKTWTEQLRTAKDTLSDKSKKAVAVVCIQKDCNHAEIYQTIKTICDTRLGIQTYFVNVNTLEQKDIKSRSGIDGAVHELARRVVVRNPAPPSCTSEPFDITVAVHVGQIDMQLNPEFNAGRVKPQPETMYLMVLSSRSTEKSEGYRTSTKLVRAAEINNYNLPLDVARFVKGLTKDHQSSNTTPHRIIILRSGYIPRKPDAENKPYGRALRSPKCELSDAMKLCNNDVNDMKRSVLVNNEVAQISHYVKRELHQNESSVVLISYVLVADGSSLDFSKATKEAVAKRIRDESGKHDSKTTFFMVDTQRMAPDLHTVYACQQVHLESATTPLVTLTLLGDPLSDEIEPLPAIKEPGKTQKGTATATDAPDTTPRPSDQDLPDHPKQYSETVPILRLMKSSDLDDDDSQSVGLEDQVWAAKFSLQVAEARENGVGKTWAINQAKADLGIAPSKRQYYTYFKDEVRVNKAEVVRRADADPTDFDFNESVPSTQITADELKRLAKLWCDDRLGLYNTKLPIPTHLAYLAVKRAQFYLNFNRKYQGPDDGDAALMKVSVHEDVKDTLYFL